MAEGLEKSEADCLMSLYLLDTCVLSELRKREKMNPKVQAWFVKVPANDLFLSVMTIGEIRRGIEEKRLHDFQQAVHLEKWMGRTLSLFRSHILPVTAVIADRWGKLCIGQALPEVDGLIAATALTHDLTLVTRNVQDFKRSGVKLQNPFA